jgi:hypothetical protein
VIAAWLPVVSPLPSVNTTHLGFVTDGNTVHLFYRDSTNANYIKSTDEGGTWNSPTTVATTVSEVPLTQCVAAVGNTVHVVYARDTDQVSDPPTLFYKRSTDGGVNWGSEVTFDDGSDTTDNNKYRVSLVADDDGAYVHCFWTPNDGDMRYSRSADGGATWSARVQLLSTDASRPEAQIDGTRIHLTWTDTRDGVTTLTGETYYSRSEDRGVTWSAVQRITTTVGTNTLRPTVAAAGNRVVLAWQWPVNTEDIMWTFSSDGGDTWAAEQTMTSGGGFEHASLQYANEIFAIAYTDLSAGITFTQLSFDDGETWEAAQQPYVPAGTAAAPLLQFSPRFLIMVDRDSISNGTKLVRSPVFASEPSSATIRDDFNRADDAVPPPGVNWTNGVITFGASDGIAIVSNQACRRSAGAFRQGGYWNANMFSNADAVVDVSAWVNTNNNGFALYGRLQQIAAGTTDGYSMNVSRDVTGVVLWNTFRFTNATSTDLVPAVSRAIAANDKAALSCRGDLIIVWHQPGGAGEWTQVAAAVDTTYAGPGRTGLDFMNNQVTRITNLWVTEVRFLGCEQADYAVTGADATLDKTFGLAANPGSYTVTGAAATLAATGSVSANPGTYAVTGLSATLAKGSVVPSDTPFYAVTGTDATLVSGRAVNAAPTSYTVTGAAAQLVFQTAGAFLIDAQDGAYTVTGADANLVLTLLYMDAQPGAYTVTGDNATLDPDTQGEVLYEAGEQGQIADYGRGRIRELAGRLS